MGFKWEDPDNAADLRKLLLKEGAQVISDMCKIAKNGVDALDDGGLVRHEDRKFLFEAMLPMLQNAKDSVKLANLASLTPEERGNKLLEAVGAGDISPQDALNVIEVLKALNGEDSSDTSKSLVINITQAPDTTLEGQVIDAMPEQIPNIN